jgi:hypothetical protein
MISTRQEHRVAKSSNIVFGLRLADETTKLPKRNSWAKFIKLCSAYVWRIRPPNYSKGTDHSAGFFVKRSFCGGFYYFSSILESCTIALGRHLLRAVHGISKSRFLFRSQISWTCLCVARTLKNATPHPVHFVNLSFTSREGHSVYLL